MKIYIKNIEEVIYLTSSNKLNNFCILAFHILTMDIIQQDFIIYCKSGDIDKVKELLKDPRVDPSCRNNWAIRLSSEFGHLDVVRELLKDSRVDPSDRNNYAIRFSSEWGHMGVVRELLKDPRINKKKLLNSDITNELRNEVLEYLTEVRDESINKILDTDI